MYIYSMRVEYVFSGPYDGNTTEIAVLKALWLRGKMMLQVNKVHEITALGSEGSQKMNHRSLHR
jgi:hypothetical protein